MPIVDGSILELSLGGENAGEVLYALGPWNREGEHPECLYTSSMYALRKGPADIQTPCELRLIGPPSCCRLLKANEETLYMSGDTRMEESRSAFNLYQHIEDGLPPM